MQPLDLPFFDRWIYMRRSVARKVGLTHRGWYYFIPVYLGDTFTEEPMVAPPIAALELLMPVVGFFEMLMRQARGEEFNFMFKITGPL